MLEEGPDVWKRAKKKRVIKTYLVSQVVGPRMMGAFKEAFRKYEKIWRGIDYDDNRFFMPMEPPNCTHQEKQVHVVNGKPGIL